MKPFFSGFNAAAGAAESEQKPEPIVTESFMVHVQSPGCKCLVVAVGDERRVPRLFKHNHCANHWSKNPGLQHELMMKKLEEIATQRLLLLIADVLNAKEPC